MVIIRRPSRRFTLVMFGLVAASIVFGACGSSKPNVTSTTTSAPKPTTTIGATAKCTIALLTFTPVFGGSAAGGSYFRLNVTNTGPITCALDGYPTITFFAPNAAGGAGSGSAVSLTVSHSGPLPRRVTLKPAQSAQFLLVFTEVPVNGTGCTSVGSVDIQLPNQSESTPVPISFSPCGGAVKVSALSLPGTQNP